MKKLRLLEIISTIPYPVKAGGTMALFTMIDNLRKKIDISLLCIISHANSENLDKLKRLWPDVNFFTYNPPRDCAFYFQKIGERIYGKGVFSNAALRNFVPPYIKYSPKLVAHISQLVKEIRPDIIQTEFYPNQDLIYALPDNIKRVFVQHEIHYVVNEMWLKAHSLWDDPYAHTVYNALKAQEIIAMNNYDLVLTLNDADCIKLKSDGVVSDIQSSPVGVIEATQRKASKYRDKIIFIGAGGHPPNIEALEWFTANVWSDVLAERPATQLHVIGNWSTEVSKRFSEVRNLSFDGFVDDLSEALAGSIAIIPILSGSGIRIKILDAVNHGIPVVSTTVGALDMGFENGRDCFIADTPEDFRDKLLQLICDENLRNLFITNSMKVFSDKYSTEGLADKRIQIYKKILSHGEA